MKRYNTPHRHRVIKTRLTEEEYAEFSERVTLCKMSQAEFIRQALIKSSIRPVITVSPVNDELLSAVGKLTAEYGKIGGNLNQIARCLNEYGAPYNALSQQWKCHTADSTDWNSKENAKMWRKDLADTINATNEQLGIAVHWEHRSFKEQGIDREPTIHIGAVANALERKGILTERGNINREIIKNNILLEQAKEMLMLAKQEVHSAQYAKIKNTAVSVKNEVMEMIAKIRERKGRLELPIVSGMHLRKISDSNRRSNAAALDPQSADNAEKFITTRKIDSFESLAKFTADKEQKYQQLETVHLSKGQKLSRLKELSKMYALFAPIQATYKESQSLKGFAKMKYDKEHKDSLSKYPELKERMQSLLQNGEKITPKQWKAEIQSLQSENDSISKEQTKTATELAYAEVISYNKKNLERELQNESRQHNRQQSRTKRREEEI